MRFGGKLNILPKEKEKNLTTNYKFFTEKLIFDFKNQYQYYLIFNFLMGRTVLLIFKSAKVNVDMACLKK